MTQHLTSRRQSLKLLAAVPALPLSGLSSVAAALGLGACGGGAAGSTAGVIGSGSAGAANPAAALSLVSASFSAMAAPSLANPAAMAGTSVESGLTFKLSDGSARNFKLAYKTFFITGDLVPDGRGASVVAGGIFDIRNQPVMDRSVPGRERQFFSDAPDGSSLLSLPQPNIEGVRGKPVFAVVQFEYTSRDQAGASRYTRLPSPIAVLTLDQDPATGQLNLMKYHNVDTSAVHGLWVTCGASLSPWNTHLSSEEYEPDAQFIAANSAFKAFSQALFGDANRANPYHYGHVPEITVQPDGTASIKKHYCLGRISHELVQVMPDQRTVLMGDDHTNGGLFMFVADREKDLSSGSLYVAKLGAGFSVDPNAAGAPITWIKLGHASSAEIEALADSVAPASILSVLLSDPADPSYSRVQLNGVANWVKLKPGMAQAAAFLETHRYAGLVGASMGFTKLEGTTLNAKDKIAYSALQNIHASMVRGDPAWTAASGISLDKPIIAGGVMAHSLAGAQKDSAGADISSDWVPVRTRFLFVGEDLAVPDALGNTAHADKVANPDNLKFSERLRTLFIGEDSSQHVNNFLWAYHVDTRVLSRLMSVPAGAESTGLHAVDELNGWTYILSNFQHPGDWSASLHAKLQPTLDPLVRAYYKDRFGAAVGYLTADASGIRLP